MKKIFVFLGLALCATYVVAQDKGTMLIKNGTVLTVTKGTLTETDVLVKDGKISQISKSLDVGFKKLIV